MNPWITTVLVVLPFFGALCCWIVPWPRGWAAPFALAVSVLEVALWALALDRIDFSKPGPQFEQQQTWFKDLHASWHVAILPFALWLIGLVAVVTAVAIGYAWRQGRERPRAYHGLLLMLLGAVVGVFVSQDVLLFYIFFELMLVPLYVLVGVWGGEGRQQAAIKLVIYTMAGSLLMLAAVIGFGLTQHTFDLLQSGTSTSGWIFLGFAAAFAVKAPLFPFHGWLPDAYRKSPPEVSALLSGVISKAAAFGFLRIAIAKFPQPAADARNWILALAVIGLVYASLLAFRAPDVRGVVAYSSMAQMGLIMLGLFAFNDLGFNGAVLQMVTHGLVPATMFLLAGWLAANAGSDDFARLGGMARGRPVLATLVMVTGMIMLAVPLSATFAGEFLILAGVFQTGWGWAVAGLVAVVFAALYGLRLISAVLHRKRGPAVTDAVTDVRRVDLWIVMPLVAALIVLSAWPAAVSGRSFGGDKPAAIVTSQFREAR